jgi:hypothetical protein
MSDVGFDILIIEEVPAHPAKRRQKTTSRKGAVILKNDFLNTRKSPWFLVRSEIYRIEIIYRQLAYI